jgi:SAM-dependent methyltransferase
LTVTSIQTDVLEEVSCAVCGGTESEVARLRVPRDDTAAAYGLPDGRSHWVVCQTCGLVYQSPRPNAAAVDALYLGGGYHADRGGIPEHYVAYSLRRSVPALTWGLDQLGVAPGRALDIGCGIGGALVHLRERGWDVAGVEPDPELSAVARDRFGLDARTGFFDDTTFPASDSFDLAYSCHVWEHLADPVALAAAARRVLAPRNGHLFIVVPTFRQARTLAWACFTTPHTYMFTHVTLGNVLRKAGFEVITHRYAADADSELWLIARALPSPAGTAAPLPDPAERVQRELATVPLRAPLGLPGRLAKHARTLTSDPGDFAVRAGRHVRTQLKRVRRSTGV